MARMIEVPGRSPAGRLPLFAAAAMLAAFAAAPAFAQGAAAKDARPAEAQAAEAPWAVTCISRGAKEPLTCQMSQTLAARNTGQRVLTAVVQKTQNAPAYTLKLALPHGLHLPDGVTVWVDEGTKTKAVIETADQNGAYANIEMGADLMAAMKKGTLLNVSVKPVSGDPIVMQLSLAGFSAAVDKL